MSEKPPRVEVKKHENYRDIVVNGIFGGPRPGYFEAFLYTDHLVIDDAVSSIPPDNKKLYLERTIQCRLVLDPVQAKSIAIWLNRHVKAYEETFGKITMLEEIERKKKKGGTGLIV